MFAYKKMLLAYLLLCSISFLLALLLLAPVKIIADYLITESQLGRFKLSQFEGNLWQGSLNASDQNHAPIQVQWSISPSHLFNEQAVTEVHINHGQSQLQIDSNFEGFMPALNVQGQLNSAEISSQLKLPNRAKMTGIIHIQHMILNNTPPYFINHLEAQWEGGRVSANNNSNQLPPLNIKLEQVADKLITTISDTNNQKSLMEITATPDKQAEVKMTQYLLNLTNQGKLSDNENDIVIRFTEKLAF